MKIEFTGKQLGAAVVVFLGVLLALAATMARGTGAGPVDAASLAQTIAKDKDHVTPLELASWILEKRQDYQLIDIRPPWQFDDYHIPTAVNIPLAQLFQDAGLKQLSHGKKIVVYGLGAGHGAEAQLLLSLKGYNAFSLEEGLGGWWDQVMTPVSVRSGTPSPAGYQQAKQLRERFWGATPGPGAQAAPSVPAPELPAPELAPQAPPSGQKLKLGRGCS